MCMSSRELFGPDQAPLDMLTAGRAAGNSLTLTQTSNVVTTIGLIAATLLHRFPGFRHPACLARRDASVHSRRSAHGQYCVTEDGPRPSASVVRDLLLWSRLTRARPARCRPCSATAARV